MTSEDHALKLAEVTSCAVEETLVICGLTNTEIPNKDRVDDEESPPFDWKDTIKPNSEGMQVTASEALQLLCSSKLTSQENEQSEGNYEKKKSGFGEGSKDPSDTDTAHEKLGGMPTSITVEKGATAANNKASVEDNRKTSEDKEEELVKKVDGQLNSSKEIRHLQEGMKNMDVQECQGSNDERGDDALDQQTMSC